MKWIKTYDESLTEDLDGSFASIDSMAAGVLEDYLFKDNPPPGLFDPLKSDGWTFADGQWGDPEFIYTSPDLDSSSIDAFIDIYIQINTIEDVIKTRAEFKSFGPEDDIYVQLHDYDGINSLLASKKSRNARYNLITKTVCEVAKDALADLRLTFTELTSSDIEQIKKLDPADKKPFWVFASLYNNDTRLFPGTPKKFKEIFEISEEQFVRILRTRSLFKR